MGNSINTAGLVAQHAVQQQQPQMQGGIPGKGGAAGIPGKGGATPTVGIPGAGFRPVMAPPVQMPPAAMGAMQRGAMGSPSMRDQAMSQVMGPFTQPNWGVPQVPAAAGAMPAAPGAAPAPMFPQPVPRAPFPRLLGPAFPGAVR